MIGFSFQVCSINSRMINDSATALPLCKSTSTFLYTGLCPKSKALLFDKSSSTKLYLIFFIFSAQITLRTYGLDHMPKVSPSLLLLPLPLVVIWFYKLSCCCLYYVVQLSLSFYGKIHKGKKNLLFTLLVSIGGQLCFYKI